MRTVLIAIGNPLRRDDGVASRVLDLLGSTTNAVFRYLHQLTPELAEEIALADTVIFIDADTQPGDSRLELLTPSREARSPLGHDMSPAELLVISKKLFGFSGQAYLCRVPGFDFSEGESLTPEAEANAIAAVGIIAPVHALAVRPAISIAVDLISPPSHHIYSQIEHAYHHCACHQQNIGDIRIHHLFQVVHEEVFLVGRDARHRLRPLFGPGDGTRPGAHLDHNAVDQRYDMKPSQYSSAACKQASENHP